MKPPQDVMALATWVQAQNFGLNLNVERITFLVTLTFLHHQISEAAFEESQLLELFATLEPCFERDLEGGSARANHLLNDLVGQRLLLRISHDGFEPEVNYRLTPLGLAIADHYLNHQTFSSLSLSVQLAQLSQNLQIIIKEAERGGTADHWRTQVLGPLKYAVADLFDRIDQNQRHLDAQQARAKSKIVELIDQQWLDSLQRCESLLQETSEALQELQRALEAVGAKLQKDLTAILSYLPAESSDVIGPLILHLQIKLDRILSWGEQMISLWACYDKSVHKFLRTLLALDTSKRLVKLLQSSITSFIDSPWSLVICESERWVIHDPQPMLLENHLARGEPATTLFVAEDLKTKERLEALQEGFKRWRLNHPCHLSTSTPESLVRFYMEDSPQHFKEDPIWATERLMHAFLASLPPPQKTETLQIATWRPLPHPGLALHFDDHLTQRECP